MSKASGFVDIGLNGIDVYGSSLTEAHLRMMIGRLYYGMYHTAKDYAESMGYVQSGNLSVHNQLIKFYEGTDDTTHKKVSHFLKRLKHERVTADYFLDKKITIREFNSSKYYVQKILSALSDE